MASGVLIRNGKVVVRNGKVVVVADKDHPENCACCGCCLSIDVTFSDGTTRTFRRSAYSNDAWDSTTEGATITKGVQPLEAGAAVEADETFNMKGKEMAGIASCPGKKGGKACPTGKGFASKCSCCPSVDVTFSNGLTRTFRRSSNDPTSWDSITSGSSMTKDATPQWIMSVSGYGTWTAPASSCPPTTPSAWTASGSVTITAISCTPPSSCYVGFCVDQLNSRLPVSISGTSKVWYDTTTPGADGTQSDTVTWDLTASLPWFPGRSVSPPCAYWSSAWNDNLWISGTVLLNGSPLSWGEDGYGGRIEADLGYNNTSGGWFLNFQLGLIPPSMYANRSYNPITVEMTNGFLGAPLSYRNQPGGIDGASFSGSGSYSYPAIPDYGAHACCVQVDFTASIGHVQNNYSCWNGTNCVATSSPVTGDGNCGVGASAPTVEAASLAAILQDGQGKPVELIGDKVKRWAETIGADKAAKAWEHVTGHSCGCEGRREWLNKLDAAVRAWWKK